MGEGYVRPPLVGAEPGSRRAAVWRFRLVALLVVILLAALVVWVIQAVRPSDPQNPGIGGPRALAGATR
jgi:hypothetical protein